MIFNINWQPFHISNYTPGSTSSCEKSNKATGYCSGQYQSLQSLHSGCELRGNPMGNKFATNFVPGHAAKGATMFGTILEGGVTDAQRLWRQGRNRCATELIMSHSCCVASL